MILDIIKTFFYNNNGLWFLVGQMLPYFFVKEKIHVFYYSGFVFATVASICSMYIFVAYQPMMPPFGDCANYTYTNDFIKGYMTLLVQRMFLDTFQILYFQDLGRSITKLILFHHFIIIAGGYLGLHYECMEFYSTSYALGEVSSIFLNFKDVYTTVWKVENKRLDNCIMFLFFVSFVLCRVVYFPIRHILEFYNYMACPPGRDLQLFLNVLSFPITLLSYYWFFWKICPMLSKKVRVLTN